MVTPVPEYVQLYEIAPATVEMLYVPELLVVTEPEPLMAPGVAGAEFTVMAMLFDVAVVVLAQAAFEVRIQVTTSPFAKVDEVKVAELVPTLAPFTFH